jgi:capsid protein
MNQFRPEQPTSTYEQFRNAILQEIARCVHMPENKALGSSASYNYSSAQLDDQIYWHSIRMERETLWEPDCLDRIFGWWFEEAINIPGYLPPLPVLGEPPIKWVWPARLSANPAAEADVAIKLINAGLLLDEQYLENQGIDPEWFNARMTEQIERRKSWGTVSQETAQIMSSEANKGITQESATDAAAQSSAEYMGLSTLQFKRNQKAVLDTLKKLAEGTLTPSQAEVFLASVGLTPETIAKLLDDASDGSVDSVAEVPSDG